MFGRPLLILTLLRDALRIALTQFSLRIFALIRYFTYRANSVPRTVVVVGGSFAGYHCASTLSTTLPSGWRVVLVEKNSHFNFTWLWPRISVLGGLDEKAFIPYPERPSLAPSEAFLLKKARVTRVEKDHVVLGDGERQHFEYLVLATGLISRYPFDTKIEDKKQGSSLFASLRGKVKDASSIAIIGGGPVGVEIATNICSLYPDKDVTIIHSRDQLMNNFGFKLHEKAMEVLAEMKVNIIFNERPVAGSHGSTQIILKSGKVLNPDLIIPCVGQQSNSELSETHFLESLGLASTGLIKVDEYLRVALSVTETEHTSDPCPPGERTFDNIFACGDCIHNHPSHGPRMGRSAVMQGMLVANNIVRSIQHCSLKKYTPSLFDTVINLSLGLDRKVTYFANADSEILFEYKPKSRI